MNLRTELYVEQARRWPQSGRHIMAQYDANSIVVYQAYKASIRDYSVARQMLGGPDFSFNRMSWIKPNFLWMMFRCGWASKENQETVLALRIRRAFFETILESAITSSYEPNLFADQDEWRDALANSEVRLQWDPDHDPKGAPMERRAIQLGLRGQSLRAFAATELLEVEDITDFVRAQASNIASRALVMPLEQPFIPESARARQQIGIA